MIVLIIKILCFSYFSTIILITLVKCSLNIRQYETNQYEMYRKNGKWIKLREICFTKIILSLCCFFASKYANLSILWLMMSALYLFFSSIIAILLLSDSILKLKTTETPNLTEEILKRNIKRRKVSCFIQATLLTLWIFSWLTI